MKEPAVNDKRVIILSDNHLLFKVIETNLKQVCSRVDSPTGLLVDENKVGPVDLIIVASSLPTSEPVVALFEAALTDHIGRTPLLIISERSFEANPEGRIFHLDFPFESCALRRQVKALLGNGIH